MSDTNRNALVKLAHWLECDTRTLETASVAQLNRIRKASRIVAELAKEFEPIDLSLVKRGADGRKHVGDFVEAADRRRCEIMIKCRAIAEEASDGK